MNPLDPIAVHTVEEARAAVREEIAHGADWIKLYPAGAYSFDAAGKITMRSPIPCRWSKP